MLKYSREIANIPNCPSNLSQINKPEAYRFVFDDLNADSFLPVAIRSPKRQYKTEIQYCSAYALSMYCSESEAKASYEYLKSFIPQIEKTLGSKLAKINLNSVIGQQTIPDRHGHFDFFESTSCDLSPFADIVGDL